MAQEDAGKRPGCDQAARASKTPRSVRKVLRIESDHNILPMQFNKANSQIYWIRPFTVCEVLSHSSTQARLAS
jgi:hypothetical protein